ncbi:hypothetical protein EII25_03445 [Erysipelotrichaceae bacterium OH741_COT-311]|nr:hypothetical protein EII25_03445 [Erysipelotrichaceae bacterium OH741_COT-311]
MHSISTKELIMTMEENLINISFNQSKALCLIKDVTEEYFNQNITKTNEWKIIYDYNSNSIKSNIIFDYILKSTKEIDELKKTYYQLFDELVREKGQL